MTTDVDMLQRVRAAGLETYETKTSFEGPWFYIGVAALAFAAVYILSKRKKK